MWLAPKMGGRLVRTGTIACDGITKIYGKDKKALSSVDLAIPAKGIFALIGRNGAGKTTLTRILSTVLEPTSGTATIDGLDVMKDAAKLRERMAIVPQEARAIPWMTPIQTITTYLMWRGIDRSEAKERAKEALAAVGMEQNADRLNSKLSGGMKRKVMVGMVIASGADFIFLDEPTTGLDPISRQELWGFLTTLGKERFLFLTTHYLEEAESVADRIGILDDGKLMAIGTMDELRNRLNYQYSVRASAGARLPSVRGQKTVGRDGQVQITTTREEAMELSELLLRQDAQFAVSPVNLDDIFYQVVGRGLNHQNGEGVDE
jgi:ABC-2 type transport system ATP-binding protein